jgi:hypothetical protein
MLLHGLENVLENNILVSYNFVFLHVCSDLMHGSALLHFELSEGLSRASFPVETAMGSD